MKYIRIGKIVNTHGIKGELRLLSSFKYKDRVFKRDFKLYVGKDKEMVIVNSYRKHKNFDMITLKGYDNINQVLKYKGMYAFINRDDLVLGNDEYFDEDIIGLDVYMDNVYRGKVIRIDKYPSSDMLVINNNDKKYLVPYVNDFIDNIDIDKNFEHVTILNESFKKSLKALDKNNQISFIDTKIVTSLSVFKRHFGRKTIPNDKDIKIIELKK